MSEVYCNINGKITEQGAAGLPVDNGAYRYGYSLFETMLLQNGEIRLGDWHMERLWQGMEQLELKLPKPITPTRLMEQILATAQKNKLRQRARIRLQVHSGSGGMYDARIHQAGYTIECFALEDAATIWNENGLITGIAEGLSKSNDSLANLKTGNALLYAMAATRARTHKWNDALVCNTAGNIIESSIANIFWIKDGQVFTPPLTEGCIAGVMRRYVMSKSEVQESVLKPDALADADEVFLTNAIKTMKWIKQIDNSSYTSVQAHRLYQQLCL